MITVVATSISVITPDVDSRDSLSIKKGYLKRYPICIVVYQGNIKNEIIAITARPRFIRTNKYSFLIEAKIIVIVATKVVSGIVMKNAPKKKRISMYTIAVNTAVNILKGLSSFDKFMVSSFN